MASTDTFRKIALALTGAEEHPHFDMASFRRNGKIFATLRESDARAMVKLTPVDQNVFCAFADGTVFFPVPNSWGKQGCTFVNLELVREDMLADALECAYSVAVKGKK